MMKLRFAILALVLSSLACMEQIATATPEQINVTPAVTYTVTQLPTVTSLPSLTSTADKPAVIVRAVVNVRMEPGGAVVGVVLSGEAVDVLECTDEWCKIAEPSGWVWRGCLSDNPANLGCEAR